MLRDRARHYTGGAVGRRLRRAIKAALLRVRFPFRRTALRLGLRLQEAYLVTRARLAARGRDPQVDAVVAGAWPVPPARLRVQVSWPADAGFFLRTGREHNAFIRELVARGGGSVEEIRAVLDFGCGCGRLARWWSDLDGLEVHGSDYNPELVEWCARNLPFMTAQVNGLEPPLPYPEERFDLVYALSVFTHLSEPLQDRWLAELRRVLRPGGYLFFTVSGDAFLDKLVGEDRARYEAHQLVIHFTEVEGSNVCAAYHPPRYVEERMLERFELLEAVPGPRDGAGPGELTQDAYLARKPERG